MADGNLAWLKWAWKNRNEILKVLDKLRAWFRSDPGRGILIIGPGGVGKTTLAGILAGTFDWLTSNPWEYEESFGVEEYNLKDDPKVNIVVPPGQSSRRETTWVDVERNLAAGQYRGVILVGANGYHTIPSQSYKDHPLYKGSKDTFLTDYRQEHRNEELAFFNRIATPLRSTPGKIWLLSVIAKEDLWWPERQDATAFYTTGAYADVLTVLASARGNQQFRHEMLFASLLIGNFLSGTGELLRKNTEGYDHRQQVQSVRKLFEVLDALREWEGTK